jgi:hypothetical protein
MEDVVKMSGILVCSSKRTKLEFWWLGVH